LRGSRGFPQEGNCSPLVLPISTRRVLEMEDIYQTATSRLLEENQHVAAQPIAAQPLMSYDGDSGSVDGAAAGTDAAAATTTSEPGPCIDSSNCIKDSDSPSQASSCSDTNDSRGAATGIRSSVTLQANMVTLMAAVLGMLKDDLQMK
ncbi:unnamed protein product, partial [Closterium sp. Naga37s-1]